MTFAPLLNPSNVVVDLKTTLPRQEVSPHEEIIECSHSDQPQKLSHGLSDDGVFQVECLHRLVDVVEQGQQIVHAESWLVGRLQQLAEEPVVFIGDKAGQRLRLNNGRHDHLVELLLQHLHPSMIDVELQTLQIMLDDLQQAIVFEVVGLLRLVPVFG